MIGSRVPRCLNSQSIQTKNRLALQVVIGVLPLAWANAVSAQSITPASNGTGTVILQNGESYTIQGGQLSGDRANLFHSFGRFGLNPNETANFLANPAIRNILGRVEGGDPSIIQGLIRVTGGNSNMYLINPAGILFGANASLNVPAAFTATTANGIGFGNGQWWDGSGVPDFAALTGTPNGFAFTSLQPGAIVNLGNLAVGQEQNLTLLGGTVLNMGQLTAPGGQITIAAVPGQNRVRLSQPGSLLSLEVTALGATAASLPSPVTLPQLLTGGNASNATGITINPNGTIQLTGSTIPTPTTPGTAIVSGQLSVASNAPAAQPQIAIVGDRVSLQSASLNALGVNGGTVRIGGDYQGQGTIPNALLTDVDGNSVIQADAIAFGNGGSVIVWADETTNFAGTITARGGAAGGNGGLVETSGKQILNVSGARVDASATQGLAGTWLLDPTDIANGGLGALTAGVFDPPGNSTIAPATIQTALDGGTNVTITTSTGTGGNGDITLTDSINQTGGGAASLTLTGRRFLLPGAATISMTSTGGLTFNLNQVNPEVNPVPASIQNAINAIGTVAGTRTINLGTGTYTLGATINIDRSLTLNGVNAASTTVSGNNAVQVFNVSATNVTLNNLTIANANSGVNGGGVGFTSTGGTLTINNSTFSNNRAISFAGGLDNGNGGTITVNNSTFTSNSAGDGGAISNGFNGGTITVNNSTFTGNSATNNGGAIINNAGSGTVTVNSSTFSGNSASNDGGGIYNDGTLTISNSTLSGNMADNSGGGAGNDGGGIWNAGTATITNSTLSSNMSAGGGGIFNNGMLTVTDSILRDNVLTIGIFGGGGGILTNGMLTITNSTISNNTGGVGGGIRHNFGTATIANSTLSGNTAIDYGGGITNFGGTLIVSSSTLSGNTAANGGGGGIANDNGGTLTVTNSTISGNTALNGGGINNFPGGTLTVTNSTLSGNTAGNYGGGAYNAGDMEVNSSTFTANLANTFDLGGGGITNANNGTLTVNSSTFSGNSAYNGGGVLNLNGNSTINNSTFSGNSAVFGGGLYALFGTLAVQNTTVSGNNAIIGGILNNVGTLVISNSIVAGNISSGGPNGREISSASTINNGNNLFGVSGDAGLNGVNLSIGDVIPTVPLNQILAPLGNYGGSTQTMALVPGSPAINAAGAGATTTDQRGVTAVGIRDIGAYEFTGVALTPSSGSGQSTTVNTTFTNPLTITLTETAFNLPLPGVAVNFAAPPSTASAFLNTNTVTTDSNGQASVTASANIFTGSYAVTATNGTASASFSLTNNPDVAFQIVPTAGSGQSTTITTAFATPLQAIVFDQFGNPVNGGKVTFTSPASGPSIEPVTSAAISSNGTISVPVTANATPGIYRVTASLAGGANAAFDLTNVLSAETGLVLQQPPSTPVSASPPINIPVVSIATTVFSAVEDTVTNQFTSHLDLAEKPKPVALPQAQDALRQIEAASGVRPALLYVMLTPRSADQNLSREANTQPELSFDPVASVRYQPQPRIYNCCWCHPVAIRFPVGCRVLPARP